MAQPKPDSTTVRVPLELKETLDDAKPYPSMSYADLFRDMLADYDPPRPAESQGDANADE